jgi:hypothetical protein
MAKLIVALAILWRRPIRIRRCGSILNVVAADEDRCIQRNETGSERTMLHCCAVAQPLLPYKRNSALP